MPIRRATGSTGIALARCVAVSDRDTPSTGGLRQGKETRRPGGRRGQETCVEQEVLSGPASDQRGFVRLPCIAPEAGMA